AQGLYQGQALTARDPVIRESMQQSAAEENDHLDWCEQRVEELGGRLSLLNPLWYAGSFAIGAAAGIAGDKWSLGFVAETEKQVEGHLDEHLEQVPPEDRRTRAILQQMKADEIEHGQKAMNHGGVRLPAPIRGLMKITAKLMTTSVYRV
ncbi:MAG: 2-polyprenyl-3-methyl-6-methoxy-1,4-benzoquinone monooxygenase, partial [Gammaproteobacteria bacterium]|nr:2-polyprenyl-3-methyl-6-methoxy-1,4-benzoquinone monooxygenase [Gammaproteobacteria bacterium]